MLFLNATAFLIFVQAVFFNKRADKSYLELIFLLLMYNEIRLTENKDHVTAQAVGKWLSTAAPRVKS
jgi:hypothetical protein